MPSILMAGAKTGSGKTIITAAILRALKKRGLQVTGGKVGPDYIDPKFHTIASGESALNLDGWAMGDSTLNRNLAQLEANGTDLTIIEGVMGLFDGASDGSSSSAAIAKKMNLPIILCLDVFGQSTSISAIIKGFDSLDNNIKISGVILTKVGSQKHLQILQDSLQKYVPHITFLGGLFRDDIFELKSRHLGLITPNPNDTKQLNSVLDKCAKVVENQLDLDKLIKIAKPSVAKPNNKIAFAPLAKKIAVVYDEAFNFIYPHIIKQWQTIGVEVSFCSYYHNTPPPQDVEAIYICGGYPELYLEQLSQNTKFKNALNHHANKGTFIFGECGGFMALGQAIVDANGKTHKMLELLDLQTSFAKRKLHLSYQHMELLSNCKLGKAGDIYKGHEFHYATITQQTGDPLFKVTNALGDETKSVGLINNNVAGSFMHLIEKYD